MKSRARSTKWLRCQTGVLKILEDHADWVELREIAYQLKLTSHYVGTVLRPLLESGEIERQRVRLGHIGMTHYRLKL